ncbi:prepilin-type N-terminal cleavage/methylation domain-containing protein [Photobacterium sp. MCCC 1A19761]|uniref:type II secretion system protein n=1 Tax=Photobacterium sp. MCCC 1A19761 TaxID=3115000 RepID=UPI00307F6EFF
MPGHQRGFTLIELIAVIILVGIISVTAASRLIGRSSFDAYLNRDQAIALVRQIQTIAMNQGDVSAAPDPCHTLNVSSTRFGVPDGCSQTLAALTATEHRMQLSVTGAPVTATRWYFNLLGRPYYLDADHQPQPLCLNSCRLTFSSGDRERAVMVINREGYVYAE